MPKMRAVQVAKVGGPLELVELEIPEPESGAVRIKVQSCGVCHSDSVTKDGLFPGIQYPRVPGHEVIGIIDAVGPNVPRWKVGQRVGVGWNGGYCGYCDSCRRGNFFACETSTLVTGLTRDGGYAEYMVAPATAVAVVPEALTSEEAAPLMCAGVTTFNCLRNSGARPGDVVAVIGLGGLGHLGIQYAAKSGFNTVAIGRGADKEALARKLGAQHYVDNASARSGSGAAEAGRRQGDPGHGDQRRRNEIGDRRSYPNWDIHDRGRRAFVGSARAPAPPQIAAGQRLVFGNVARFAGDACLQRALRRALNERKLPTGAGGRGLRAHDVGEGKVPGSAHDGEVALAPV